MVTIETKFHLIQNHPIFPFKMKGLYLGFIVVYIVLSIIAQLIGLLGTIRENVHTVMMYIILETIQTLIYLVVAIIHTIVFIPFTITLLVALWAAFYVYDLQIIKHNRSMVDDVILHTSYVSYWHKQSNFIIIIIIIVWRSKSFGFRIINKKTNGIDIAVYRTNFLSVHTFNTITKF